MSTPWQVRVGTRTAESASLVVAVFLWAWWMLLAGEEGQ